VDRVARRCSTAAQERFSWSRIVDATEMVYRDALGITGEPTVNETRQAMTTSG
jgi:hypothetical protein